MRTFAETSTAFVTLATLGSEEQYKLKKYKWAIILMFGYTDPQFSGRCYATRTQGGRAPQAMRIKYPYCTVMYLSMCIHLDRTAALGPAAGNNAVNPNPRHLLLEC